MLWVSYLGKCCWARIRYKLAHSIALLFKALPQLPPLPQLLSHNYLNYRNYEATITSITAITKPQLPQLWQLRFPWKSVEIRGGQLR